MFPTAIKERAVFVQLVSHISWPLFWPLFFTHVIIVPLVSQVSFVFCVLQFMLPLSKSGSTQTSWLGIRFESGLESDVTGASSSTSEGSGLLSGERTDKDGGRTAWVWGRGLDGERPSPGLGLLLRVRLRFWSKPKLRSLGEELVRLFRESNSGDETGPTSWLEFLSRKWFVTSGWTVEREEK